MSEEEKKPLIEETDISVEIVDPEEEYKEENASRNYA